MSSEASVDILPQELIRKKRDGGVLSAAELAAFFAGFLQGKVADYQVSALLMATLLKGMTERETVDLTRIMRDSGEVFTWPYPRNLIADKHSTGGIGDKTSMVVLPLALLAGLKVPMMAGRGLGHTGGTLDKLEAIGWNVFPTPDVARSLVDKFGGLIMGQTASVAPLDRRLYAMRDVTATVESIPLIVGSILSKKLAEGIGSLVLDVKFGSGAFMQALTDARALAMSLASVGRALGLNIRCVLSNMNSPLGKSAGNALEIAECLAVLNGKGPKDTRDLSLALAVELVRLAFPEKPAQAILVQMEKWLDDGTALRLFIDLAMAQGAAKEMLEDPSRLPKAPVQLSVKASAKGKVSHIDTRLLGLAVLELGGGRRLVTDKIDPRVGLTDLLHVGDAVDSDVLLAKVHAADTTKANLAKALVEQAYRIGPTATAEPLILEMT